MTPIPSSGLPCRRGRPLTILCKKLIMTVNLNCIPTKIGTEMCINEPFMCSFSLIGHLFGFYGQKCEVCKKRKKNKETFACLYLRIGWCDLLM